MALFSFIFPLKTERLFSRGVGRDLFVAHVSLLRLKLLDHGFFSGQEGFHLVFRTKLVLRAFKKFLD